MTLTKTQAWVAGTAAACSLVLLAGWLLLVGPQRAEAAELREATVSAQDGNLALEQKIALLEAQFADLPTRRAELAAIQAQLPSSPQLPELVREIDALAAESGVIVRTMTPGEPTTVTDPAADPAAAATPDATTADGTAAAPATGVTLVGVPLTLSVEGDFAAATLFLQRVQTQMARSFLIERLEVVPLVTEGSPEGAGAVTLTTAGRVFALHDPANPAQQEQDATDGTGGAADPFTSATR